MDGVQVVKSAFIEPQPSAAVWALVNRHILPFPLPLAPIFYLSWQILETKALKEKLLLWSSMEGVLILGQDCNKDIGLFDISVLIGPHSFNHLEWETVRGNTYEE